MDICFEYGEHTACVWVEDIGNSLNWHLGFVDEYDENKVYMSNMKIKQIKKGKIWLFFEEKEIRLT